MNLGDVKPFDYCYRAHIPSSTAFTSAESPWRSNLSVRSQPHATIAWDTGQAHSLCQGLGEDLGHVNKS